MAHSREELTPAKSLVRPADSGLIMINLGNTYNKSMRKLLIIIHLVLFIPVLAQSELLSVFNREQFSLNGKWNYIVDQYETGFYAYHGTQFDELENPGNGAFFLDRKPQTKWELIEYDFDLSPTLMVPGDWNTQDSRLFLYEGTIWYRRLFDYKRKHTNSRIFLHFGAVNYEASIYLNGKLLGRHTGGFTPFAFEITDGIKNTRNSLVVKVTNTRKPDGVPTTNFDWMNYGGITRDVTIVEVPATFISDYFVQLKKGSLTQIEGYIRLNGNAKKQKVVLEIPEIKVKQLLSTNENGFVSFSFETKKLTLWSPENPKVYDVILACETDKVIEKIGFRSIEVSGTEILLNKKPVFLRGICAHEENPLRGARAYSKEDAMMLLNWAKDLNCNFMRLAHYPHNEYMARLADAMGIMLWEEIPVYWTIEFTSENTLRNARNQLAELIARDKNRASVIIWSVANETPVHEARTVFLTQLAEEARMLDNTRLVSAALEVSTPADNPYLKRVHDPFAGLSDIVSFNVYVGWYDGLPDKCDKIVWDIPFNKPVIISEFGGGALQGFHGDTLTRWTEEFQEYLYRKNLAMLLRIPQLRGTNPWILCDFRSPKRLLPQVQDGWNRKGVIGQNGTRKKAFYVLQEFYQKILREGYTPQH